MTDSVQYLKLKNNDEILCLSEKIDLQRQRWAPATCPTSSGDCCWRPSTARTKLSPSPNRTPGKSFDIIKLKPNINDKILIFYRDFAKHFHFLRAIFPFLWGHHVTRDICDTWPFVKLSLLSDCMIMMMMTSVFVTKLQSAGVVTLCHTWHYCDTRCTVMIGPRHQCHILARSSRHICNKYAYYRLWMRG